MEKKQLITLILSLVTFSFANAQESVNGIIVTFTGSEISYKLDETPTVKYAEVEGKMNAVIYLKDIAEPVASFPLGDNVLTITYGEYNPTAIEGVDANKVSITEKNGKKYISGGKLVIIAKDGKQYDIKGNRIK